MKRLRCAFAMVLLLLVALPEPVRAHPHVFINNVTSVVFEQGRIVALRMEWVFDEIFSMLILEDFNLDRSGTFSAAELETIERDAFSNLRYLSYLTHLRLDGTPVAVEQVKDFTARSKDGLVHYAFTIPLEQPVDPRRTPFAFGVYDESFYIAVEMDRHDPVRLAGAGSAGCHYEIREDKDNPIYFGLVFPRRVDLVCATS